MKPLVSIIIPAYNEVESIGQTIDSVMAVLEREKFSYEIIAVDDSSTDNTLDFLKKLSKKNPLIKPISKGLPHGMGSGIKKGIEAAVGKIGIVVMADGVDDLNAIPAFVKKISEENFALVVGSRYLEKTDSRNIPFLYKFCSRLYVVLSNVFLGIPLHDLTNAYRAFELRDFAKKASIESNGFEISAEITSKAWFCCNKRAIEIACLHKKRGKGYSKFSFAKSAPGYSKIFLKSIVLRLTGKWL